MGDLTSAEICAGAGGQALGLEQAGFAHQALAEIDPAACATLRHNRPGWKVIEGDVTGVDGTAWTGIDLLAGGPPCPPFSVAGKQLGAGDERDLFPQALRLVAESRPRAVLLENVPGMNAPRFASYRAEILRQLYDLGYGHTAWGVVHSSDFGVPQFRPRFILVAIRAPWGARFRWPDPPRSLQGLPVGEALHDLMAAGGWPGADRWAAGACKVAPTIVGGSKKHGGPDLGPTRARAAWAALGVNGKSVANDPPGRDFPLDGMPRLTLQMVARLQGFPGDWVFTGRKTAAYRQVGNAFPPPVARIFGAAIREALREDS